MSSMNRVILVGRIGRDPEGKSMPNGDAVTNFSVATSERWKDKAGEQQEKTEWHRCVAFKRTAEVVAEYAVKGTLVGIEGKLQTRKWTDKDGVEKYSTEIIADRVQLLSKPSSSSSEGGERQKPAAKPAAKPATGGGKFDDFEDDIPY